MTFRVVGASEKVDIIAGVNLVSSSALSGSCNIKDEYQRVNSRLKILKHKKGGHRSILKPVN